MTGETELVNLVDELLYLVEVGSGSTTADESELAHLLDRLALAMRTVVAPAAPAAAPVVPARDRDVLRKIAASRFPRWGAYRRPGPPDGADDGVANAIDDVATIADHLHAVAWLWRSASFDAGLSYLDESHGEWGRSMRSLQLYLFDKERAARDAERAGEGRA